MRTPLQPLCPPPASVRETPGGGFILELPDVATRGYRVAQLDDYRALSRSRFLWREPTTLSLRARISAPNHPGTWGFGLWNDPFSVSLGIGGTARRLPALPNAVWFFHASPQNYLSFRSDKPASGFLAQVFSAPRLPAPLISMAAPGLPLLGIRPLSRWLRAAARQLIREDSARLDVDATQWHAYRLRWGVDGVDFAIDGTPAFHSGVRPQGPLGLVIWIDNQFAAWHPDGKVSMGALPHPRAWLEISDLEVTIN